MKPKHLYAIAGAGVVLWLLLRRKPTAAPKVQVTLTDLSDEDLLILDDNGVASGAVLEQ